MRQLEFPAEARRRLASQQGGLRAGCGEDLTTPLIPRDDRDKDLKRKEAADSLLAALALGSKASGRLRGLESEKLLKLGTFSRRPGFAYPATRSDSLEDQIRKYFTARPAVTLRKESADYATECVSRLYQVRRFGRLSLLNLESAAASQFPRNTGLGFPVISSDSGKYLYEVYKISEEIHNSGYDLRWVAELPALLGVRGQPRGPASVVGTIYAKTRVIYAMSRAVMNVEKRIQAPLQSILARSEVFSAWGTRADVARAVTRLFTQSPRSILSVDFKSFDVSVPECVLERIFRIIEGWFTGESAPTIRFAKEAFMRCGILCPDLYLPGSARTGGVPSGSVMTNLIDSLVNLWVMHYSAHRVRSGLIFALAQGDDGVYTFHGTPSLSDLCEAVSELGMTISPEKSMMCSDAVHFLQDLHERDYTVNGFNVGQRPFAHIINSALSQERNDGKPWDRACDTIRWLQQWGEGLYHPSFKEAVDWLYHADWMCAGVLTRLLKSDINWLREKLSNVNRKDSNSFWGLTPSSFLSSPVVKHLMTQTKA
jgi:hypothetical protein